jgi:hypothetical protein
MLQVVWVQNASQKMQSHQSSSKTVLRTEETQIPIPNSPQGYFVRNAFVAHNSLGIHMLGMHMCCQTQGAKRDLREANFYWCNCRASRQKIRRYKLSSHKCS